MPVPLVYPTMPGLDIDVVWRPKAINFAPQVMASGREVIIGAGAFPMHEFDLTYNFIRGTTGYTELVQFLAFFLAELGELTGFRFTNPYDNQVTGNATFPAQADGIGTDFVVARTLSFGGYSSTEPVGYVNTGGATPFKVYDNGVLKTGGGTDYTLIQDYVGGANDGRPGRQIVRFNAAPVAGHPITCDATYDYFVRFAADTMDFAQFLWKVFEVKRVKLQSIRPYGLT